MPSLDQFSVVTRFLSDDAGQEVKVPSATDTITYISVPLAVAGVLPTLSVVLKTFIFSLHIRSKLEQNLNTVGLNKTPFWLPVWSSHLRAPSKRSDNPRLQDGKYFDVNVLMGPGKSKLPRCAPQYTAQKL